MCMMMMMTLMKLVNSATKFRHGIDKVYQPNSGLRGSKSRDEAIHIYIMYIYIYIAYIYYIIDGGVLSREATTKSKKNVHFSLKTTVVAWGSPMVSPEDITTAATKQRGRT